MSQGHDWSANQINPLWGQTEGHYPRDFELENFEAIFAFFNPDIRSRTDFQRVAKS